MFISRQMIVFSQFCSQFASGKRLHYSAAANNFSARNHQWNTFGIQTEMKHTRKAVNS